MTINDISGKYAAEIDDATDIEDLDNVMENLIYDMQTALKVKSLKYSANINTVIQHIKINLDRPLCLNELADLVGLAPSYLSRLFNQETDNLFRNILCNYVLKRKRFINSYT